MANGLTEESQFLGGGASAESWLKGWNLAVDEISRGRHSDIARLKTWSYWMGFQLVVFHVTFSSK